jgi:galactokinase
MPVSTIREASQHGDATRMGKLMVESHRSLQRLRGSCAGWIFLVQAALEVGGVRFADDRWRVRRMCGDASPRGATGGFRVEIARAYERKFGVVPGIYSCEPSEGAAEVKKFETIPV